MHPQSSTTHRTALRAQRFQELAEREPALRGLEHDVRAVRDTGSYFCQSEVFARHFKGRMSRLVGYDAVRRDPILMTPAAFEAVYAHLLNQLPPCRACGCLSWPVRRAS